ncbi:MAG: ABC transporter permease [Clostridia bacterium]|nr:ABC transporter permease [Clostridia bacterium]MBQ6613701.1 ABC transporter permease [Clostridia bacterium]
MARIMAAPHILWSVLFIVAPMMFVFYYAFTDKSGAFTLDNIAQLASPSYLTIFARSGAFALVATAICLVVAYPLAYAISRANPRMQKFYIMLTMLPMWMNFLIRTYSIMAIIEDTGFINTLLANMGLDPIHMINTDGAVIFGMVYNYLPYMVLPIHTVLSKLDNRLLEASADLGCTPVRTFFKVVMPMSRSGVVSGITMVFVPSVSTFYISQKLGGSSFDLIGDTIERQFQTAYNYNLGAAISLVLMVIILISMAIMNHYSDDEGGVVV